MKSAEFHPAAKTELAESIEFYDRQNTRLGDKFAAAVEMAVRFVCANPEAGAPFRRDLRRWVVRRFPYSMIYRVEVERVYILAVAHHRRKPDYWEHRI